MITTGQASLSITRLQKARERLESAVARLEEASQNLPEPAGEADSELAEELRVVRARCEDLEQRSRDVSEKLDTTIDRVKGLLDD